MTPAEASSSSNSSLSSARFIQREKIWRSRGVMLRLMKSDVDGSEYAVTYRSRSGSEHSAIWSCSPVSMAYSSSGD